jgi:SAM-dependent methyltransferase
VTDPGTSGDPAAADAAPRQDAELYDDAALYDAQYRHYRDDLPFYRELALDRPGAVLEVGAGSGRVTVELARLAETVVALEPSPAMRAAAARRLRSAGLADRVELRDLDVRALDEPGRFALAVAPFHALMHLPTLDDQDRAVTAIRRALAPGAAFACDVAAPPAGVDGALRRVDGWRTPEGGRAELFVTQRDHPAEQRLESRYLLDVVDEAGRLTRHRRRLVQRYYHRFELERALRSAGFGSVRLFGDFDRRPVDADARRYVALATVSG